MRRTPRPDGTVRLPPDERRWSLLTAHAEVLLCIARDPDTRVREIAATVGISERGAHQIVADLVDAGYVRRARVGRRNRYAIESKTNLKHAPVRHRRVASIVALLEPEPARAASRTRRVPRTRLPAAEAVITKPSKRRAA
ncbi:MAG TPA: winged helix-turn-helix domain-containing protein [Labilithrix sp.]|nr:winged helix-turn-helix domain-containing protein [Labilithrix sp.]